MQKEAGKDIRRGGRKRWTDNIQKGAKRYREEKEIDEEKVRLEKCWMKRN